MGQMGTGGQEGRGAQVTGRGARKTGASGSNEL